MAPLHPLDDSDDAERLAGYAHALADGIEATLGVWVARGVVERAEAWRPGMGAEVADAAHAAGDQVTCEVIPTLRRLLDTDVDAQRTGPLAVLRGAVAVPTALLADLGVPPVERDEQAERLHPDDVYDLVPGAFADIDPDLREVGLLWGAAKAHVVMARRRAEGQR